MVTPKIIATAENAVRAQIQCNSQSEQARIPIAAPITYMATQIRYSPFLPAKDKAQPRSYRKTTKFRFFEESFSY